MAALTIQTIAEAGVEPSYAAAAAGGDTARNDNGNVFLHVKNGDASPHTVTVTAQRTSASVPGMGSTTKSNVSVAVPAGTERMIGPFAPLAFNDSSNNIAITYDDVTSVTIAALELPRVA
jgi:hypothetical protein